MKKFSLLLPLLLCACATKPVARKVAAMPTLTPIFMKTAETAALCPTVTDGDDCLVTWQQAVDHCQSLGQRLPTARDYVETLKPLGIKVIEQDEDSFKNPPAGFYLVDSVNLDGARDTFSMNHSEYQRPKSLLIFHLLWTSSSPPQHPTHAHVFYDQWGGGGGEPDHHRKTYLNSFQCAQ